MLHLSTISSSLFLDGNNNLSLTNIMCNDGIVDYVNLSAKCKYKIQIKTAAKIINVSSNYLSNSLFTLFSVIHV